MRLEALRHFVSFIGVVEEEFVVSELMPMFNQLANDDQDAVQHLSVAQFVGVAKCLQKVHDNTTRKNLLEAPLQHFVASNAVIVRVGIARKLASLARVVGKQITDMILTRALRSLLYDGDVTVRSVAESVSDIFSRETGRKHICELYRKWV